MTYFNVKTYRVLVESGVFQERWRYHLVGLAGCLLNISLPQDHNQLLHSDRYKYYIYFCCLPYIYIILFGQYTVFNMCFQSNTGLDHAGRTNKVVSPSKHPFSAGVSRTHKPSTTPWTPRRPLTTNTPTMSKTLPLTVFINHKDK